MCSTHIPTPGVQNVQYKISIIPTEQSSREDYEKGSGVCVCRCAYVVNIVNPAVDWPPLLHALTDHD